MNRFDRVFSTLLLLQSKKRIAAKVIAERFDISLRTVYRDIRTLKLAGVPIIGDPGIGYSLVEGYQLPPLMFTEDEAAAMLTAEKIIGKITDQTTKAHYSNALLKIRTILRGSEKQSLAILDESIATTPDSTVNDNAFLQTIFKSLTGRNVIKLEYKKADDSVSNRYIEPIGCYHQGSNWYLVAYCQTKEAYRTFRLNRILALEAMNVVFDRKHISLKAYMDQANESWKNDQDYTTFKVVFNKPFDQYAAYRKYYFGFLEQTEDADATTMTFLNPSIEYMARWLIQFSDQVTVIEPQALTSRLSQIASDLYRHYQ